MVQNRAVSKNPFAELEAEASFDSKTPETQVAVSDNAFEDPVASSRVNRDPNAFDASRPLFIQNDKAESPAATRQARMLEPSAQPAKVAANSGNNLHESQRPLTWETARVRLNELGIKDYYVQPHPSGEIFHFRCTYTPPDNPRITRLFEAEAAEPLEAVRKVLVQVENWTKRQTASSN